ncbi:MAG: methylaspartate mutase, partial [Phycisphaerae bacterium]|nr:methylaspartate mutase [Phycisphaerae bacterium]
FATTLKGVQQQRTVGDTFSQQTSGQTIVNNMTLDLLVASGGVLSHAPRMHQTAMMLIDAFEPEGVTMLAKDSIFMMPHLGVLSSVHPKAAEQVFDRDCLVYLGTCVCAAGQPKPGKLCFKYELTGDRTASGEIVGGQMTLLPLDQEETGTITLTPARGIDLGEGPGKKVQKAVRGGTVGLILDGRGRPLSLPEDRASCQSTVQGWLDALDVYAEESQTVGA